MRLTPSLALAAPVLLGLAAPSIAEETRQLGAHEHGRGVLNLAVDGDTIAMELIAPAADIVGFEHDAETDEDRATLEKALADLGAPLALFGPNAEAGCAVTEAEAERVEMGHDEHEHEEHAHEEGEHEEHAEEEGHDEHAHEEGEHDEHAHEEEDHDHEHGAHSEIHAEYLLTCSAPDAFASLALGYFDRFTGTQRLDVTVVSDKGQERFETRRGDASVDLSGAL